MTLLPREPASKAVKSRQKLGRTRTQMKLILATSRCSKRSRQNRAIAMTRLETIRMPKTVKPLWPSATKRSPWIRSLRTRTAHHWRTMRTLTLGKSTLQTRGSSRPSSSCSFLSSPPSAARTSSAGTARAATAAMVVVAIRCALLASCSSSDTSVASAGAMSQLTLMTKLWRRSLASNLALRTMRSRKMGRMRSLRRKTEMKMTSPMVRKNRKRKLKKRAREAAVKMTTKRPIKGLTTDSEAEQGRRPKAKPQH